MFLYALIVVLCMLPLHSQEQKQSAQSAKKPLEQAAFAVTTEGTGFSKAKAVMLHIGHNGILDKIAQIVHFDLEFSDQLAIDLKRTAATPTAKQAAALGKQGYTLMLVLEEKETVGDKIHSVISLKDPATNAVLFTKSYTCLSKNIVMQGHKIASELMPVLTNEDGPMLSTLAYCKQIANDYKIVCIADYACRLERPIVTARTINVAPSWHSKAPGLCYSQFTKTNSRLMYYDLISKKHTVVCSYDGLNMQPSFSTDGSKAALCLSGNGNSEIYLYDQVLCKEMGKKVFKQLTNNKGNNASPCLLENNDLVFCSDFQTGNPQLYLREAKTLEVKRLSNGKGYCASPCYNAATKQLVYIRYINGFFQLHSLNLDGGKRVEKQLTKTPCDKLDPTISACGKYIAFVQNGYDETLKKRTSQIATLNTKSNVIRVLTTSPEAKSYPSWSGRNLYGSEILM
jgi:tol-pal system beta propeller repeat protein TolB